MPNSTDNLYENEQVHAYRYANRYFIYDDYTLKKYVQYNNNIIQ